MHTRPLRVSRYKTVGDYSYSQNSSVANNPNPIYAPGSPQAIALGYSPAPAPAIHTQSTVSGAISTMLGSGGSSNDTAPVPVQATVPDQSILTSMFPTGSIPEHGTAIAKSPTNIEMSSLGWKTLRSNFKGDEKNRPHGGDFNAFRSFACTSGWCLLHCWGQEHPTQDTLFSTVKGDFSGQDNFIYWFVAIIIIGAVGYIPKLKPISTAFLALVIVVLFLKKGSSNGLGGGFFAQATTALGSSTATTSPAVTNPSTKLTAATQNQQSKSDGSACTKSRY